MQRRNFLKGLFGIAVSLTPAGTIIEKLVDVSPLPAVIPQAPEILTATAATAVKPIIIKIANNSLADVHDVDVFGAFQYINNPPQNVDFIPTDTESYREIMQMLMMNPISIERTFIVTSDPKQLQETVALVSYDANGNNAYRYINPLYHRTPYDVDCHITDVRMPYVMDGFTMIKIPKLLKRSWIEFRLYPLQKIDLNRVV